ncbi:hypothetical protein BDV95DRAFT_112969 [Massariosphaeria phaeospora]|uniref:Rhodopsin domain-containing protein n=1 Tax=Massariosphaeria phaeospora TaxID=100035 RepID=A0A7C8I7D5_9PLEO|nr:hypothetical protein BDV95DRAFT_112969 [Massariosphaeria phaeospora]
MFQLNSQGQKSFNVAIACMSLGLVAVVLRLVCKRLQKNGFHLDDFWIVLSVFACLAAEIVVTWGNITGGGGNEMEEILKSGSKDVLSQVSNYLQGLLLSWTFYLAASFTIKMSLLSLYRRLFTTQGYRQICLGLMALSVLWFVGAEIGNFIICIPFDSFWNRLKPGRCLNFNIYALAVGIVDVVIDFCILAVPVKIVVSLHLPMYKKIAVSGIFLLGGFTVVTGALRVYLMYQPFSIYVHFAEALMWSNIHLLTAIICACLPVYKPLWQAAARLSARVLTLYNSRFRSTTELPSFVRRDDGQGLPQMSKPKKVFLSLRGLPLSGIGSLNAGGDGEERGLTSVVSTIPEENEVRGV